MTSIGESAFAKCGDLLSVEGGRRYLSLSGTLLSQMLSILSEFVFDTKQTVKVLERRVWENCAYLRYVQFRKGIKTIVGVSGFHCSSGSSCECGKGFQNVLSEDSAYFSCTPCPLGTFSPSNSLRNTSCQPCGGGTFMSDSWGVRVRTMSSWEILGQ